MLILQNVELVLSNDAETVAFLYPHNLPALGVIGVKLFQGDIAIQKLEGT